MNISYNWLLDIVETKLTPQELGAALTSVGLTVESVHSVEDDWVLDIDLTSNRPDCLSHLGVAREIAAIAGTLRDADGARFKPPVESCIGSSAEVVTISVTDAHVCPRYSARIIRGVTIGPSPDWLVKRLRVVGERSINNVADITNFVMHELGQPMHAFDLATIAGQRIDVRAALADESLVTLDGIERKLQPDIPVICDADGPVALAGIMGGSATSISPATQDVLIEAAYFDPAAVRRASKQLGLTTEASHRFERGIDWAGLLRAQDVCAALILELAGATSYASTLDQFGGTFAQRDVALRAARIKALTGLDVDNARIRHILAALGFAEQTTAQPDAARLIFTTPTWRTDVAIEADLVEEVARHVGMDQLAAELPPAVGSGEYQPNEPRKKAMRRALAEIGYNEAISYSFISTEHDGVFASVPGLLPHDATIAELVTLTDAIVEGATRMRPSLLPGLLDAVRHNMNHGTRDVTLFEIGRVFSGAGVGQLPNEREALALVATGGYLSDGFSGATRELDFYDSKGALETAVAAARLAPLAVTGASIKHLREGQSAAISTSSGQQIGSLGRLAEELARKYKFRQPVFVAELDLTALLASDALTAQYTTLARFPAVVRDVSLLVQRNTTVAALLAAVREQRVDQFAGAELVGVYEGAGVPEAMRSVTLRLEYRAEDRTLRDQEVEELHGDIVGGLLARFHASLRT